MRSTGIRAGFTLVELLVVMVIISVLVALLLPAVNAAREQSRRAQCGNNLKNMALGILEYEEQNLVFPPAEIHGAAVHQHCRRTAKIGIWMNMIFPFIELQNDYDKLDFNTGPGPPWQYDSANNRAIMRKKYPLFQCPTDPYDGLTLVDTAMGSINGEPLNVCWINNYGAVSGSRVCLSPICSGWKHPDGIPAMQFSLNPDTPAANAWCNAQNGIFFNDSRVTVADIRDGLSTTAMLCETWGRVWKYEKRPTNATEQMQCPLATFAWSNGMRSNMIVFFDNAPNVSHCRPERVNSFHPGGVQIAFADNSVKFVANQVDFQTYQGLATRNGPNARGFGEVIDPSKY